MLLYHRISFQCTKKFMDTLGIEPNTSRMLSERDNQLHHVPLNMKVIYEYINTRNLNCSLQRRHITSEASEGV